MMPRLLLGLSLLAPPVAALLPLQDPVAPAVQDAAATTSPESAAAPPVVAWLPPTDPRLTDVDRDVLVELTDVRATPRATFHYRAGDVTPEQLDGAVADVLAGFETLERVLEQRYEGTIHVFVYKDHADLEARTGSGAIAFSCGTVSLHMTHDFRGVHELVHLFAVQFSHDADSHSDLFVVEGLATMLSEFDQGVPIHAWAAVDLSVGRLPELLPLRATFPEGAGRGVHPYHVAGSFVGFLIERFGMAAVKRYYVDATEAHRAFGSSFPTLERQWRLWLATLVVEPAHRAHVLDFLGLQQQALPEEWQRCEVLELLGADWQTALQVEDPSRWTWADGVLTGVHDGPWTRLHSTQPFGPRVGLRVRFRMLAGDALGLRLNHRDGVVDEAILAAWSTYVLGAEGHGDTDRVKLAPSGWHDVVFLREDGTCRLYLDDVLVLEVADGAAPGPGAVGVGLERGTVELASVAVVVPE